MPKKFLQTPLGTALVGGAFTIGAVILTMYLTDKPDSAPERDKLIEQQLQRENELARREALEANCKRTADGRYEAVALVELLETAVRDGRETLSGGENSKRACKFSSSISWEFLDGAPGEQFFWIDAPDGEDSGGRLLCGCFLGNS